MKNNLRFATKGLLNLNFSGAKSFRNICKRYSTGLFMALLLPVLMTGCSGGSSPSLGGAPTVTSTTPNDGATNVAANTTPITAVFSKAMDATTITSTNFTVTGVAGTVGLAADGVTASFTPTSNLPANTNITATIANGVKSSDGQALTDNKTWSFKTSAVASTVPVSGGVLPVGTPITATFYVAMDASSIEDSTGQSTFTVEDNSLSTLISGAVTYDATTKIATFTPKAGAIVSSRSYTATIKAGSSGVKDSSENPMLTAVSWTFTAQ